MELNARAAGPTHQEITARSPRDAPEVLGLAGAWQKWGWPDIPAQNLKHPEESTPVQRQRMCLFSLPRIGIITADLGP